MPAVISRLAGVTMSRFILPYLGVFDKPLLLAGAVAMQV
jgi:hypothetical protein